MQHEVPGWVKSGAVFHIRVRVAKEQAVPLTDPKVGDGLLAAARDYHERGVWHCRLILLMPDHLHALLAFPAERAMTKAVGAWKRYANRAFGVKWQVNFFDHRIRSDDELTDKWAYILRNPVVKGLCAGEQAWRWSWQG